MRSTTTTPCSPGGGAAILGVCCVVSKSTMEMFKQYSGRGNMVRMLEELNVGFLHTLERGVS